ncbi:MAG: tRNA modification GTPase MnmE [Alphaproteobacteria bacterium MarineAlpha11_Bin1]|nr:MAG: tRNA modification GTPase MnmE [Alphaproteobacteria bacterium MarineAlpha11_Bin1]|tara:strand:+ start:966 stop:2300 length:1335 start_codon:yes stop_codon:yes gene_type:complete
MTENDTIFALATAKGRGGISIFRISGVAASVVLLAVTSRDALPEPRQAIRCRMVDPSINAPLDDGVAIWFPQPASFTGEDVAELHCHGGRATCEAIAAALSAFPGIRMAEPGEFSKRAFLAGKIDLTEAEAIADLIDAETEAQRRQALAQLGGGLSSRLETWRSQVIEILAYSEAWIDFPEDDIPTDVEVSVRAKLSKLAVEIEGFLDDKRRGERLRDGLQVAILGAPNAGKSSLMNALAARDVAIVSEKAGTTRDVIEVHLDLGGWPVTLADTAGVRDAVDPVEQEGIRRAVNRAETSDICLVLFDQTGPVDEASLDLLSLPGAIAVSTKIDLKPGMSRGPAPDAFFVSAKTGDGLQGLLSGLEKRSAELMKAVSGDPPLTRLRHRTALKACLDALRRASTTEVPELFAEDLRQGAQALGSITGRVDIEDLLDVIFADFCIGK